MKGFETSNKLACLDRVAQLGMGSSYFLLVGMIVPALLPPVEGYNLDKPSNGVDRAHPESRNANKRVDQRPGVGMPLVGHLQRMPTAQVIPDGATSPPVASECLSSSGMEPPTLHPVDTDRELYMGRFCVLTGLYTMVEGVFAHPYDLIKTRQQASAPGSLARSMGTASYFLHLVRTGGIRELYRGFGWAVVAHIPSDILYYAGYTEIKRLMLGTSLGTLAPSAVYIAAGCIADALSVLVSVPAEVVSQRLQLQGVDGARGVSRSGLQVVRGIVASEGILGMWRGTGASICFYGPSGAAWWLTHEHAKKALSARFDRPAPGTPPDGPKVEPSATVLAASGALAGIISIVISNPLDVIKTRMQTAHTAMPMLAVARSVTAGPNGWRGLFNGLTPRLLSVVPRSICSVLAYERAIEFCRKPAPAPAMTRPVSAA